MHPEKDLKKNSNKLISPPTHKAVNFYLAGLQNHVFEQQRCVPDRQQCEKTEYGVWISRLDLCFLGCVSKSQWLHF